MENNCLNICLINAGVEDFEFVKNAKLFNIFEYAKDVSDEEKLKILNYVDKYLDKYLDDFKMIVKDKNKCGCYLIRDYQDGILLDEIFLLPEYRNKGIGTDVIKSILKCEHCVYLCVYKDNIRAVKLYEKLGFETFDEKDNRYWMCYNQKNIE